jgi:PPM family protein phosphatase
VTLVVRHGALSDIGLHRKTNEDAFVVAPPLFAVCDGMGGAQAGEVASALAAETLAVAVATGRPLLVAAEEANGAVFARANENAEQSGMGTTLTALVLEGDSGRFVHIGDSRVYLLRGGVLQQLSDDHSLVGEMVRDGRLSEQEAQVHPHRSILSRALGTEAIARIDEFEVDLLPGDVILLCSDGLSGPVKAESIRKALDRDDPADAARKLIAEARKHGGPDNITALVLRFEDPTPPGERAAEAIPAGAGEASPDTPPAGEAGAAHAVAGSGSRAAPECSIAQRLASRRLAFCATLLAMVLAVAMAGALMVSTVFYVGVDDGHLAVFSGVPAKVGPLPLHAVYRSSARQYAVLAPSERRQVDQRILRSKTSAMALANELGMW